MTLEADFGGSFARLIDAGKHFFEDICTGKQTRMQMLEDVQRAAKPQHDIGFSVPEQVRWGYMLIHKLVLPRHANYYLGKYIHIEKVTRFVLEALHFDIARMAILQAEMAYDPVLGPDFPAAMVVPSGGDWR